MKKFSLIFLSCFMLLNLLILQPLSALAETETPTKPEATNVKETVCPPSYVGQSKCFRIDNPTRPKTKVIVVPSRPVVRPITNPTGVPGGASITLSVLRSIAESTPAGQRILSQFQDSVTEVDLLAGEAADAAVADTATYFNSLPGHVDTILSLNKSIYEKFQIHFDSFWNRYFSPQAYNSSKLTYLTNLPLGDPVYIKQSTNGYYRTMIKTGYTDNGIERIFIVVGVTYTGSKYFSIEDTTRYKYVYDSTLGQEILKLDSTSPYYRTYHGSSTGYATYSDAYAYTRTYLNDNYSFYSTIKPLGDRTLSDYVPRTGTDTKLRIPPMLPDYTVPAIIETDAGEKYWEVPDDAEPDALPDLVPTTPDGTKIPGRKVVIEDGREIDPNTGEPSLDPIVAPIQTPGSDTGTVPGTDPGTDEGTIPTEEEEAKPMWASLMIKLSAIGTAVTGIYDKIKTCKACTQTPDIWNPWVLFAPYLAFMIAALTFLGAIALMIVSIPLIPKKPFPEPYNEVIEWFRQYTLGGIVIYDVMISLTFLLLAFFIYKLIRRSL